MVWAETDMIVDYECFGDLLAFDTTYKTNMYKKPLLILVEINHHKKTTVFGFGLLIDESVETFKWMLFKFLHCMKDKHPVSVITDGDKAMAKALEKVMPNTKHRLCAWHLEKNCAQHVKVIGFFSELKALMFKRYDPNEFEGRWNHVMDDFKLYDNSWCKHMYDIRHKWAECYFTGHFFSGTRTTQCCESMNSYMSDFLKPDMTLAEFLRALNRALARSRNDVIQDDFISFNSDPPLNKYSVMFEIEQQASKIYTRAMFNEVHDQILKEENFKFLNQQQHGDHSMYIFTRYKMKDRTYFIKHHYGDNSFLCQCKYFERTSIHCRHIFATMKKMDLVEIPECLILKRWCKNARGNFRSEEYKHLKSEHQMQITRYASLTAESNKMCYLASQTTKGFKETRAEIARLSSKLENLVKDEGRSQNKPHFALNHRIVKDPTIVKTKGALKKTNDPDKVRRCNNCNGTGHDKRNCPYPPKPKNPRGIKSTTHQHDDLTDNSGEFSDSNIQDSRINDGTSSYSEFSFKHESNHHSLKNPSKEVHFEQPSQSCSSWWGSIGSYHK